MPIPAKVIDLYVTIYCKFKNYCSDYSHNNPYRHRYTRKSPGIHTGQSDLVHGGFEYISPVFQCSRFAHDVLAHL